MSSNTQDTLRFIFQIEKKGDVAWINQFANSFQQALTKGTQASNQFASSTQSSFTKVQSNVGKTVAIFDSFGNRVSTALKGTTASISQLSGMSGALNGLGASLQGFNRSMKDVNTFTKTAVTTMGQFDTSIRKNNASMTAGSATATRYSAIFKQIEANSRLSTASINQNSAAITQNTAKIGQNTTIIRNAISGTKQYQSALQQQNATLMQTATNTDKLSTAQTRQNQSIIQNARGMSTLVLSFAMLNSASTDYRINQESMADINQKVTDAQERLASAMDKYGEKSFQAQQAADALAKAERGLRFELREQQNQLNNMLFLYILIGQEIVSNAIPAFLNWGTTVAKLRTGFASFTSALAGLPAIFTAFTTGAKSSSDAVAGIDKNMTATNRGISILSTGFQKGGTEAGKFGKALTAAGRAGDAFRGGIVRLGGALTSGGGLGLTAGLAAVAVGLTLYGTNAGGARDMTNAFGVSVGKLHPILEGIGQGLVGIAGAMGLTGESADQMNHHFEESGDAFAQFADDWHSAVESMKSDTNDLVSSIGSGLALLSDMLDSTGKALQGKAEIDTTKSMDQAYKDYTSKIENYNAVASNLPFGIGTVPVPTQEEFAPAYNEQKYKDNEAAIRKAEEQAMARELRARNDKIDFNSRDFTEPYLSDGSPRITDPNRDAYLSSLESESVIYASLKKELAEYNTLYEDYVAQQNNATVQGDILRAGQQKYLAGLASEQIELKKTDAFLKTYQDSLNNVPGQQHEILKGQMKQKEAYIQEQAAVFQLQGQYSELFEQVTQGTAIDTAYATGILDTNIALLEREKAISKASGSLNAYGSALAAGKVGELAYAEGTNQQVAALQKMQETIALNNGVLDTYHKQIEEGTILTTARKLAMQEQEKAALDLQVANAGLQGTYDQLNQQLSEGQIQIDSYNKGFLNQQLATKQQILSLSEASGALDAYNNSIKSGEAQTLAFTQGAIEMARTQAENYVALSNSAGALDVYTGLLEQGVPQYNAFTKAAQDAMMTIVQMPEQIAGLKGSYETMLAAMDESEVILQKQSLAYFQAKEGIRAWGDSLIALEGTQKGTMAGLSDLTEAWGIHIPEGLKMTAESAQGVIEAFSNMEGAAMRLASAAHNMGLELLSGVTDAIRDGGKEVNETIDGIEERLGFEVPDGIKEAWESASLGEAMVGTVEEGIALLQTAWATGNTEGVDQYVDNLQNKLNEQFDQLTPEMRDKVEPIMKQINAIISEGPDPNDPNGMIVYMNQIMALAPLISDSIDPMAQSIDGLNSISLEQAFGTMEAYRESIQETARVAIEQFDKMGKAADDYAIKHNKIGQSFTVQEDVNVDNAISLQGMENAPPLPTNKDGGGEDGTQATIDAAITSLDQLKAKSTEVFNQIAADSASATGVVVTNFGTMATGAGGILAALATSSEQFFQLIGAASSTMVPIVSGSFLAIQASFGTTMGQMISTATASFGAIGNAARVVAVNVTTHYNTAHGNAQGVLSMMETDAETSFQAQGDAAVAVAEGVDTHFGKAADDGIALMDALERSVVANFEAMADAAGDVAAAIDKIGQSADTAKGKVDSLKNAVEALPDIERTITYRIRTVGSAPAGAGAGIRAGAMGIPYMVNMAGGGAVNIREGQNRTITTGESGDEFVRVFDQYGTMKEQVVKDIKSFTLQAGEAIQVQPLEGYYGKRFRNKFGDLFTDASFGNIINMAQGGEISGNNPNNVPIYAGEPSGEWAYNANAKVTMEDGSKVTLLDWNNQQEDVRKERMNDITTLPENYALYSDGRINRPPNWGDTTEEENPPNNNNNTGGNNHEPGSFGGTVTGDSNVLGAGGPGYYDTVTGYSVPDYVQSPGHGANSPSKWENPNMDPRTWSSKQMQDDPNLWKVVDDKGINIAAKFKSKAEADEFIQEHLYHYNPTNVPPVTGGNPPVNNNTGGGTGTDGTNQTQTNTQNGPGNNINYQNQGPQNNSGIAGNTNQSVAYDPYNRNLTAGQWGKSYLGNNMWYDPIYKNGVGNPMDPDGNGIEDGVGSGGSTQIVETPDGKVRIEQGNGQQTIIIDGRQMLPFADDLQNFNSSVNQFNSGVNNLNNNQQQNTPTTNGTNVNSSPTTTNNGTNNTNVQSDVNTNSNLSGVSNVTNTGNPSGVSQTQTQTGSGKYYQSQNGKVNTNMTPAEIAAMNEKFPWLNLDPSAGVGGGGPGTGTGGNISGRIIRRNLGQLNMTGIAGSTPQSVYNNMDAKNDPTGWFNYPLLADPLLKEIPTRSLLPSVGGNLGNGGNNGNISDMMNMFKQMIMQMIREAFGQPINVNIGDDEIINIVRGGIMNGYSNYK